MEKLEIAKILKPQGIKGDVKIALFVPGMNLLNMQVFVDETPAKVEKFYQVGDGAAVKLDIISSRNDAENFRGKTIFVEKNQIKVEKGKFLVGDLLGKTAILQSGKVVGTIFDISNFGSADVISIKAEKNILCSHKEGLILKIEGQNVVLNDKIFAEVSVYED